MLLMGDKSQDQINFEFLGKDKTTITLLALAIEQAFTNWVLIALMGSMSMLSSGPGEIVWLIDGKVVRKAERKEGEDFLESLFCTLQFGMLATLMREGGLGSMWWTGKYMGCDAPQFQLLPPPPPPLPPPKAPHPLTGLTFAVSDM